MEKGFYWVQRDGDAPEVWYFANGEGGGWYQSSQSLPQQPWISNKRDTGLSARGSNRRIFGLNSISSSSSTPLSDWTNLSPCSAVKLEPDTFLSMPFIQLS